MARIDTLKNFLTDIADKFRAVLGTTEAIPHSQYDARIDEVYESGKKAYWKALLDGVEAFDDFFTGKCWTEESLRPEVDIVPITSTTRMFGQNLAITDLDGALQKSKGKLDTSNCAKLDYMFNNNSIAIAPPISLASATSAAYLFNSMPNLHTVRKIITKETGGCPNMYYIFTNCPNLVYVRFEGLIDRSMNLQGCAKLDEESLVDLFKHLFDFSGTTREFAYTLTLSAKSTALLDENTVMIDGLGWREYLADKKWNVAEVNQ